MDFTGTIPHFPAATPGSSAHRRVVRMLIRLHCTLPTVPLRQHEARFLIDMACWQAVVYNAEELDLCASSVLGFLTWLFNEHALYVYKNTLPSLLATTQQATMLIDAAQFLCRQLILVDMRATHHLEWRLHRVVLVLDELRDTPIDTWSMKHVVDSIVYAFSPGIGQETASPLPPLNEQITDAQPQPAVSLSSIESNASNASKSNASSVRATAQPSKIEIAATQSSLVNSSVELIPPSSQEINSSPSDVIPPQPTREPLIQHSQENISDNDRLKSQAQSQLEQLENIYHSIEDVLASHRTDTKLFLEYLDRRVNVIQDKATTLEGRFTLFNLLEDSISKLQQNMVDLKEYSNQRLDNKLSKHVETLEKFNVDIERIATVTLKTQKEFGVYKTTLNKKLEASLSLQHKLQHQLDTTSDQLDLKPLKSRVEKLEEQNDDVMFRLSSNTATSSLDDMRNKLKDIIAENNLLKHRLMKSDEKELVIQSRLEQQQWINQHMRKEMERLKEFQDSTLLRFTHLENKLDVQSWGPLAQSTQHEQETDDNPVLLLHSTTGTDEPEPAPFPSLSMVRAPDQLHPLQRRASKSPRPDVLLSQATSIHAPSKISAARKVQNEEYKKTMEASSSIKELLLKRIAKPAQSTSDSHSTRKRSTDLKEFNVDLKKIKLQMTKRP